MKRLLRKLTPWIVLLLGGACTWWLLATAPTQDKGDPVPLVPRVAVQPLTPVTRAVSIEAFGTVSPSHQVDLAPQIEGSVIAMHPSLAPGGLVSEGDELLRIDPSDYDIALAAAEARQAQAQADLELELGRGVVARREWERFADVLETVSEEQRSAALALREPQLKRAESVLAAARNAVDNARLQLTRTSLRAPFDAVVLSETVELGRRLSPATPALRLVGVDSYWVTASVPLGRAARLPFDGAAVHAPVIVELETGMGDRVQREGRFLRRLPDLEAQGRMARVLVAVDDPLGLSDPDQPVLPLGAYVRLELPAGEISDVYEAPREALRENDQVWVRDADGRLRFRTVHVAWRGDDSVLLRGDFEAQDELIVSYLSDPLPGLALDVRRDDAELGTDDTL
ncbi:MAG: hemolysin D [Planctomycetota bacterium]|nr:MAG: hemolysin D [Planctomycetota bacterium]